jgi:hypothetical protein
MLRVAGPQAQHLNDSRQHSPAGTQRFFMRATPALAQQQQPTSAALAGQWWPVARSGSGPGTAGMDDMGVNQHVGFFLRFSSHMGRSVVIFVSMY